MSRKSKKRSKKTPKSRKAALVADQHSGKTEEVIEKIETELDSELEFDESDEDLVKLQAAQEEAEKEVIPDHEELEVDEAAAEGSELEAFDSAEVEEVEAMHMEEIQSVVESLLFATEKPMSAAALKSGFAGTKVRVNDIRKAVQALQVEYAGANRGVILEEVAGGYQLRTKPDNMKYLKQTVKGRPFRLSGPALEVLSIVAYKQPCIKANVDEVRGVESGHLMRGLLERGLIRFAGKSELPGRPMNYETTRKFLEIFGLRNLKELPSLSEIDQIIPEGIDEVEEEKETLSDLTGRLSEKVGMSYSEGEEELTKISDELSEISTSSEFFEQEKQRQKEKRDADRADEIRERIIVGEEVSNRDKNWLERYEAAQAPAVEEETPTIEEPATPAELSSEAVEALKAFDEGL